ncbi:hypothetical protein BG004_003354 [Podila humilis]|nr:hypothetical protein BG004_003354 [Podila humilis]
MLPQNLILFITLWNLAAASPVPSVITVNDGIVMSKTGDSSMNNLNGVNEGSFNDANAGLGPKIVAGYAFVPHQVDTLVPKIVDVPDASAPAPAAPAPASAELAPVFEQDVANDTELVVLDEESP